MSINMKNNMYRRVR